MLMVAGCLLSMMMVTQPLQGGEGGSGSATGDAAVQEEVLQADRVKNYKTLKQNNGRGSDPGP